MAPSPAVGVAPPETAAAGCACVPSVRWQRVPSRADPVGQSCEHAAASACAKHSKTKKRTLECSSVFVARTVAYLDIDITACVACDSRIATVIPRLPRALALAQRLLRSIGQSTRAPAATLDTPRLQTQWLTRHARRTRLAASDERVISFKSTMAAGRAQLSEASAVRVRVFDPANLDSKFARQLQKLSVQILASSKPPRCRRRTAC
ncbi:MAG: hypothetical protein RL701_6510 [Pseudomonadota bacterium]|jgi:hypothetical protein